MAKFSVLATLYKPPKAAYNGPGSNLIMTLAIVVFLVFLLAVAWWLSGYDSHVTGENPTRDFIRRALRILISAALVYVWFGYHGSRYGAVALIMIIPISLGVIWVGCLSELCSHKFHNFLYSGGTAEPDPHRGDRELNYIASLLKLGYRDEAVAHCEKLLKSGDANVLAMETLLARAGIEWTAARSRDPLAAAYQLRTAGKIADAEKFLTTFLMENPASIPALLLLIRVYAQDLKDEAKAVAVLQRLERVPRVPVWQVDFARKSIPEWLQPKAASEPSPAPLPQSVDDLLAQGFTGTAIETLEQKIKDQPDDYDLLLKLAEAHGRYCKDVHAAQKIIRKIEHHPAFTPAQIATAKTKLAEWRAATPSTPKV